jgi:hypothetical protein
MKHRIDYINSAAIVTISLEDLYREYVSQYMDILWDMRADVDVDAVFFQGINTLLKGDRDKILKMFKDGESPIMLGSLMKKIETWNGLDNYPEMSPKQPFALVIASANQAPIIISGEDVNF